jgi:hypothetical protein
MSSLETPQKKKSSWYMAIIYLADEFKDQMLFKHWNGTLAMALPEAYHHHLP